MSNQILCYSTTTQVGPWRVRLDKPHGRDEYHQEHVHISRRGVKGDYSWNKDGSRHDKHKFPNSQKGMDKAKRIAAKTLNVPETSLQFVTSLAGGCRATLSEVESGLRPRSIFTVHVRTTETLVILGTTESLVLVTLVDA